MSTGIQYYYYLFFKKLGQFIYFPFCCTMLQDQVKHRVHQNTILIYNLFILLFKKIHIVMNYMIVKYSKEHNFFTKVNYRKYMIVYKEKSVIQGPL